MIRKISIASLLCALCHLVFCFKFEDCTCGSRKAIFKDVSITGCNEADERCALVCGTYVTIFVTLIPQSGISHIKARALGKKGNMWFPYDVEFPLICSYRDTVFKCPIYKDREYRLNATMHVPLENNLNLYDIDVQWEFVEKYDRIVSCIKFPARLIGGVDKFDAMEKYEKK